MTAQQTETLEQSIARLLHRWYPRNEDLEDRLGDAADAAHAMGEITELSLGKALAREILGDIPRKQEDIDSVADAIAYCVRPRLDSVALKTELARLFAPDCRQWIRENETFDDD